MCFQKQLRFSSNKGLELLNVDDRDVYLRRKIEYFSDHSHYTNKEDLLSLFQEILNMSKNDKSNVNSIFDDTELRKFQGINLDKTKEKMIDAYNMILLGSIFLNVFDKPKNRLIEVQEGINGPISTSDMFSVAYKELVQKKHENKQAYGATLIFMTILENELKGRVKKLYSKEYLFNMQSKIIAGSISLTPEEEDLFNHLCFDLRITNQRKSNIEFNGVYASTEGLYGLLANHSIISGTNRDIKNMILNKYTLNPFLNSSFLSAKADPRFIELMKLLFNTDKLDLRNNLAHNNFGHLNYFHINYTALLYGICHIILSDYFLV